MSIEGFNRQFKRRKLNQDFISIHFDPDVIPIETIAKYFEQIAALPERRKGTVFTMRKEGLYFKKRR